MKTYEIIDEISASSEKMFNELTRDRGTSFWLKDAMATMKERDICDALNDAEMLVIYLHKKFNEMHG